MLTELRDKWSESWKRSIVFILQCTLWSIIPTGSQLNYTNLPLFICCVSINNIYNDSSRPKFSYELSYLRMIFHPLIYCRRSYSGDVMLAVGTEESDGIKVAERAWTEWTDASVAPSRWWRLASGVNSVLICQQATSVAWKKPTTHAFF